MKAWIACCVVIACRSPSKAPPVDDKPVVAPDAAREPAALRKVKALFGSVPASFGPALDGLALGMTEAEISRKLVWIRSDYESTGTTLSPEPGRPMHELVITTRDICQELLENLWATWGDGTTSDDKAYWVHPSAPIRASYRRRTMRDQGGDRACDVRFEWYVTPEHWIAAPDAVVPDEMVGKQASALRARLEKRATAMAQPLEDGVLFWTDVGVGLGSARTQLWAKVAGGKVRSIVAETFVTPETWDAVEAHLTATYGQPSRTDESLRWNSKPPINIDQAGHTFLVVEVGTPSK